MKQLFFALLATTMLASCSKKETTSTPPVSDISLKFTRIHHVYGANQADVDDYSYDNKGRLVKHDQDEQYTEYNYDVPGKIQITGKKKPNNNVYQTGEAILDASGRITKMLYYDESNVLKLTYFFTYDANGYLINKKGITPGYTFEHQFEIVNGNPVSIKIINDGVHKRTGYYTYQGNLSGKTPFGYVGHWPATTEFGKSNKFLCTEYREVDLNNVTTWHYKFQFEVDAAGYVRKTIGNDVLAGKQSVTTYTLQ